MLEQWNKQSWKTKTTDKAKQKNPGSMIKNIFQNVYIMFYVQGSCIVYYLFC